MTTTTLTTNRTTATAATGQVKAASRLLFIDNIRVFLTILVILHHLTIIYAGSGSWGFYTEGRQDTLTAVLGTWFCAVNQAYFMGFFLTHRRLLRARLIRSQRRVALLERSSDSSGHPAVDL